MRLLLAWKERKVPCEGFGVKLVHCIIPFILHITYYI